MSPRKLKLRVETHVNVENCSIFVKGMEINCPICGTLVKSGESHTCSRRTIDVPSKKLRK